MSNVTDAVETWVSMLGWLADAPLFIDAHQVARFYDAVLRPEGEAKEVTLTFNKEESTQRTETREGQVTTDLGLLSTIFPFLPKMSGTLKKGASTGSAVKSGEAETVKLSVISNPERQLEHLILYYLSKYTDRLRLVSDPTQDWWRKPEDVSLVPRQFVFLDLPGESGGTGVRGTKLIPTAAEFSNGKIALLYDPLVHRLSEKAASVPIRYPERALDGKTLQQSRQEYWSWFEKHFSAVQAMQVVEEAASENGRIRWIDYRLPLNDQGDTLHLHIAPSGEYDTGTFAYNLIKRGYKHGIRLVGTLKSEPDMNVLAIYDK